MNKYILFGGTFDPVHKGHIHVAVEIVKQFQCEKFIFIPCKIPVLKKNAAASPAHRLAMLELALKPYPDYPFYIDTQEINRKTPSYTIDTLKAYKQREPSVALTWMLGYDSFLTLPQWKAWDELLSFCDLLIIERQSADNLILTDTLRSFLSAYEIQDKATFMENNSGCIYQSNAGNYAIASSNIRKKLKEKSKEILQYVDKTVLDYIQQYGLYGINSRG